MELLIWAIVLMVVGFAVFGLEFFIPSAGLLAILCGVLLITSVVLGFMSDWRAGLGILTCIALLLPVLFNIVIRIWPHTYIGKKILIGDLQAEDVLPHLDEVAELKLLVGREAVARSKMLPSGIIRIDGKSYDAVSEGFGVESGQAVRIIAVRNKRLIVEAMQPATTGSENQASEMLDQSLDSLGLDIESLDSDHAE